ncbi:MULTISPECIES: GbsR/MarR family transcriptional regulator [Streptomyces]|uniref:MarR family transcriptional regulator n=1 Tax=Streptomyces solicathayae TaxID=3081768 RepID=A0ABZ0LLF2_9ACTN|nr:MarR family transcriptional regulator [Streptomyces sp. HUAS YS2]WOX20001.1 MarR family transcriptional regulator [Streptomyces sp. HUAS YS2]
MPGGRLTRQDREGIADGLADGLTYTEIAARLDRPLSTVTREVSRNGGPDGYRADQAQQATQDRARRSRPGRQSSADTGPARRVADPDAVQELEDRFTDVMVGTGLSRMAARVLSALYLTDSGSLSAAELVERLKVSPASVSKAIGQLEQQELLRRERDSHHRRERYVIDADAWFRGWTASARQNSALADFAHEGAETLGAASPAGGRLNDIGDFFQHVGQAMLHAAEQWRQDRTARRTTEEL